MLAPARRGRVPGPFLLRTPCAVSAGGSHSWDTALSTCAMSPLCHGASGKVSPGWLGTRSLSAGVLPLGNEPVLGVDREIRAAPADNDAGRGRRGSGAEPARPAPSPSTRLAQWPPGVTCLSAFVDGVGEPGRAQRSSVVGEQNPPQAAGLGGARGDRGGVRATSRGTWVLLH